MSAWKKIKDSAWRVKTIKDKNVPGWIPAGTVALLLITGLYYIMRDTTDEATKAAESRAKSASTVVVKHGGQLTDSQQLRTAAPQTKAPNQLETGKVISKVEPLVTSQNDGGRIAAEKKAKDALAALYGNTPEDEAAVPNKETPDDGQNNGLVSAISGMVTGNGKKGKTNSPVVKGGNMPPPAGTSKQTPKTYAVTLVNPNYHPTGEEIKAPEVKKNGYETNHFLPIGSLIPVYFMTTVDSASTGGLIELAVAENVVFNHRVQLERNRRIFVTGGNVSGQDRMLMTGGVLLDHTGAEGRILGVLMDQDKTIGVRGYWKASVLPKLFPYVNTFAALWLAALQEQPGVVVQSSSANSGVTAHDIMLREASRAITDAGNDLQKTLERRYGDHLVIPQGTFAYVQITESCDLTVYARGLSAKATPSTPPTVIAEPAVK